MRGAESGRVHKMNLASCFSPSSSSSTALTTNNHYDLDSASFDDLVATEYPVIHSSELVHLDHAASPPPPVSTITSLASKLTTNLYFNPHSHLPTQLEIDSIRSRVMQVQFGLNQRDQQGWDLVWTSGTTASLQLVAQHFPWCPKSRFRYLKESHTSLVGIRGPAFSDGADVESLDLEAFLSPISTSIDQGGHVLHAYPAQCNVTGSRLGLRPALHLARNLKGTGLKHAVMVDAAAYLSTSPLDLSAVAYEDAPDFIAGSFYKTYGHPTGLGFLLVKRSSSHLLTTRQNVYYGGGSIEALAVSAPYWVHRRGSRHSSPSSSAGLIHQRFENGTVSYISIVALGCAMDSYQRLFTPRFSRSIDPSSALKAVSQHAHYLANIARNAMSSLTHWQGTPLVRIHKGEGSEIWEEDGPTIAFTLYTPSSSSRGPQPVGHMHLLNLATLANIQLRAGGLCNTGVLARINGLSDRELWALWEDGRDCGDAVEFGGENGNKPLGLARISFGACSSIQDVQKFINFLRQYFLISKEAVELRNEQSAGKAIDPGVYLEGLVRYPIKSCAGEVLSKSCLTLHGLLHDREFAIINNATGKTMSQKQFPRMALIQPTISAEKVMTVRAPKMRTLEVDLRHFMTDSVTGASSYNTHESVRLSAEADGWLSEFLEVPCHLHRFVQSTTSPTSSCAANLEPAINPPAPMPVPILFSNESPFTLISSSSVHAVDGWIRSSHSEIEFDSINASCFRANFILSSSPGLLFPPFHEDTLSLVRIGTQTFQVLAKCRRCLMICVDPETGVRMREPFCCLAKNKRNGKRRVEFGVHLTWRSDLSSSRDKMSLLRPRDTQDMSNLWEDEAEIMVGDKVTWTVAAEPAV
ncbi:hypothetical protein H0H93_015625 [Arthromyces matolae]|nr:hypothetical protein H0H93_015625 [Arthromyces matolae]